jgi:Ca-activated chloride channel family protein
MYFYSLFRWLMLSLFLFTLTFSPQSMAFFGLFGKKPLELVFTYGSEKEKWIEEVTQRFNQQEIKTQEGQPIEVKAIPMGSGEAMEELLEGRRQAHLVSPASAAFIELYNARSEEQVKKPLVGETKNLVLSPVVIAMWKPMAEALGWGTQPIGWADILKMAKNPKGWAEYGYPQWGKFKWGHTHPQYSNSGLISLLAEAYAATGKNRNLKLKDITNPATGDYIQAIEQAVVHYGRSTGFFGRKMFANGPDFLSAVVLYENMVIESYNKQNLPFPIVAIYPKEGTFWSDHPVGIVERDWVTEAHREAAQVYINYLLAKPQQELALKYGFRPSDIDIPLQAPFDTDHGVDPNQPQTVLKVPSAKVIEAILKLWQERKKHANVVLVMDVSGSMNQGNKIKHAREGAVKLLSVMREADHFSLLAFNHQLHWVGKDFNLKEQRPLAEKQVKTLIASGGTALYDAIANAYHHLRENPQPDKIAAIVVLSDGADRNSQMSLPDLLKTIQLTENSPIRIFPIGYGKGAEWEVLSSIAEATQTKAYKGETKDIEKIFRDISTFF